MTLQVMYNYVATNPGTTAHLPREIRKAPVGVPYEKAARLVMLGYLRSRQDGHMTRYEVTEKEEEYRHSGCLVIVPWSAKKLA